MKKLPVVLVAVLFLGLVDGYTPIWAQGFSSILEKLDQLEQRLEEIDLSRVDRLEERLGQMEAAQKKRNRQLQQQLAQRSGERDLSAVDQSIAQLQTRVDDLSAKMAAQPAPAISSPDAIATQELATDLRALTGELRTTLESAMQAQDEIPGLTLSGFVDASYGYDISSRANSFGLDQVEVNVEQILGERGAVHADLEWVSDGEGGFTLDTEQGYLSYQPSFLGSVTLTFGKFNAPIGFELLDAPDMYQYSHALVFDYGLPGNLSGAMFSAPLGTHFDGTVYVSNGWDENVDGNKGKTIGGRLGVAGATAGAGLSVIHGTESTGNRLTVVDVDLSVTPAENWTLGGEFNHGRDKVDGTTHQWQGFLLMAHVDLSAWGGMTVRYDYFDDGDALRLGSGLAETRQALTVAPTFVLGDGMGALVEWRLDASDEKVFADGKGNPSKSASNLAFEMTYSF